MKPMVTYTVILSLLLYIIVKNNRPTSSTAFPGNDILFHAVAFTPPGMFTNEIEGPAVNKEGSLFAVNYQRRGTIGKVMADGSVSIFLELPKGSVGNGIRFDKMGNMLVADYTRHNILKIKMSNKEMYVLAHDSSMHQPNDIALDKDGCIYASDPDWKNNTGNVLRIDPDGKITVLESGMGTTNGIEISPDNKTLYVNESVQRRVWAYDLMPGGTIERKRLLVSFPDFELDGMRCDREGNLFIARYGKGTVVKISPAGKVLQEIVLEGKNPSNVTFGGNDNRTVYVTVQDKGNIEMFRVDVPGKE